MVFLTSWTQYGILVIPPWKGANRIKKKGIDKGSRDDQRCEMSWIDYYTSSWKKGVWLKRDMLRCGMLKADTVLRKEWLFTDL